jgi:hypothetical protein
LGSHAGYIILPWERSVKQFSGRARLAQAPCIRQDVLG